MAQPDDERRVHTQPTPLPRRRRHARSASSSALCVAVASTRLRRRVRRVSTIPLGVALGAVVIFARRHASTTSARCRRRPRSPAWCWPAASLSICSASASSSSASRSPGCSSLSPDLSPLAHRAVGASAWPTPSTSSTASTGWPPASSPSPPARFFLYGAAPRPTSALIGAGQRRPARSPSIVLGICLGFLPHNFHPARIFMGDGGALLLGPADGGVDRSLVGGQTDDAVLSGQAFFFFAPLFIPLVILGRADPRHAVRDRAPGPQAARARPTADKDHLHHRLMRLGHGQRRSVLILWTWTALLSGFVLYPVYTGKGDAVVPVLAGAMGLILLTWFHPGVRAGPGDQRPGRPARRRPDHERLDQRTQGAGAPAPATGEPTAPTRQAKCGQRCRPRRPKRRPSRVLGGAHRRAGTARRAEALGPDRRDRPRPVRRPTRAVTTVSL